MALLAACGLLQHCKIATEGLGPYDSGQAGNGSNEQGAGGGPSGSGGFSGQAGSGQAGTGAAGTTNGSGGAGAAGDAGSAGAGGAGSGGVSGTGGTGGSGGGKPECDAAKGEFSVPNAPTSCFFFLADDGKAVPPSSREEWSWDEAVEDCKALGAQLASLATIAEYNDLRDAIKRDRGDGLTINASVWIGARTNIGTNFPSEAQLMPSFVWQNEQSTWVYTTFGAEPWGSVEPTRPNDILDDLERCVEMRNGDFLMNNLDCGDNLDFALCERDAPIVQ